MYNFDKFVDRRGTACVKWDVRDLFGVGPDADLTPMWIADMDFAVVPEIQTALKERCDHPTFGYNTPTPGCIPALCSWYERRHNWKFTPDQVLNGIGVVTMIRFTLEALTAPGDQVAVFSPVYDPFFAQVRNSGRTLVDLPMKEQNGHYSVDLAAFEQALKDGVRAVIFCNPHNPIGKVWTKDEVETIGGLCAKYGAYMLSDEVHGDMVMDGNHYNPMGLVDAIQDKLVVYTAISKTFNLAGLHQSAIIIPNAEVRAKVDAMLKGAWIMGPNLMAFTAMEAAYTYGDKWVDEVVAYISDNVRYVQQQVRDFMPKVKLSHHEGTFLMWLDLRCLGMSSDELTVTLGREYGIGLGNGAHYGKQCDGFMRMNIACPRSTLEKGVAALKKCYLEREAK
ncbi:MAG: MalY/PatB family protein [Oscillospiraceae bacterium]|nr:pyridoxal phosphate-dependent aminotransferase [Eubacteriales bacterium]MDY2618963.1 MalY/PatB family protein [Oscillospiraceae bacterium]